MFFQLADIDKLSNNLESLQRNKESLNTIVIDAYQSQPQVKNSLSTIIAQILDTGTQRSQLFQKIQEDSMHGFLVPSYIDFDEFTKDRGELPEWTRAVFEKEFQKQKPSLDVMAKKIYASHSLTDAKNKHERQVNSFKLLCDRYKVLSEFDQTIDIMNQAQKLKNMTKMTTQKFMSFLKMVASKLIAFIDQMSVKCQYFSQDLNNVASKSVNSFIYQQNKPEKVATQNFEYRSSYGSQSKTVGDNWLTRANRTLDRNAFRGNPQNYLLRQPKWLSTYSSDYYM